LFQLGPVLKHDVIFACNQLHVNLRTFSDLENVLSFTVETL